MSAIVGPEKKKGGHSGLPTALPPKRIQQACPLFFAALQTRDRLSSRSAFQPSIVT
jgi:hypothetical protein